jgi:hypothetical protein
MNYKFGIKMIKLIFVFPLCLIIYTNHLFAQNSFEISYQTPEDEVLGDGIIDNSGNVLMVGIIGDFLETNYDGIVFKVYPDGDYIYRRVVKQDTSCQFGSIILLDNGNYMIFGRYAVGDTLEIKDRMLVLILNPDLEMVMEKTYRLNNDFYVLYGMGNNTLIDADRNIVYANARLTPRGGNDHNTDYYFMRFNQQGDTLLTRGYESWPSVTVGSLRMLPGTDTLMVIGRGYNQNGYEEMLLLDHEFNIIESFDISQSGNPSGQQYSDVWLNETEFLMTRNGITDSRKREYYATVSRLNTSGELLQELILDRPDTLEYIAWYKSMSYRNDSTIYIGVNQSYNTIWEAIPMKSVVYIIDKDMNLLGRKDLGGDTEYEIISMVATEDDGCMLFGARYVNNSAPDRDIYIWKVLREDFELITSVEDYPLNKIAARAWPNPADDLLHISLEGLETGQDFRLRIYNIAGQKYLDKALTASGNTVQCRIDVLPSGTYVYELQTADGQVRGGKFIKK